MLPTGYRESTTRLLLVALACMLCTLTVSAEIVTVYGEVDLNATSTFALALTRVEGETTEVCVYGWRGWGTHYGEHDIEVCVTKSFAGWQPDLCEFPPGAHDIHWIFAVNDTKGTQLTTSPVEVMHSFIVNDPIVNRVDDEYLSQSTICCGRPSVHVLEISSNSSLWGTGNVTGELTLFLYFQESTDNKGNFTVSAAFSCSADPTKAAPHVNSTKDGEVPSITLYPEDIKRYGWRKWYFIVKPDTDAFYKYHLVAQAQGKAWYPNTDCSDYGKWDPVEGVCKCIDECFSGPNCTEINNCSEHGHCVRGKCICSNGFNGKDCEFGFGSTAPTPEAAVISGGVAAFLAIGMFILGSIAGVVTLLLVNKKIRRVIYQEVSIQDTNTFSKAVS